MTLETGSECAVADITVCSGAACRKTRPGEAAARRAAHGYQLCSRCRAELRSALRGIPSLYEECGLRLTSSSRPTREKTSGGPLPGMRLDGRTVEVRAKVFSGLASWAGLVVEERMLTAPQRSVPTLAMFLDRHVDWLCRHTAAGELSCELADLVRAARRIVAPAQPRQVRVGRCVEPGCSGTLSAVLEAGGSERHSIRCDEIGDHHWEGHEWLRLRDRMERGGGSAHPGPSGAEEHRMPRWLGPRAVSRLWGIPTGSVYRLASEHGWERCRKAGRTYYAEPDVRRTLSRRESPRTQH